MSPDHIGFIPQRPQRPRTDLLALMTANRTKGASPETAAVCRNRELHRRQRRHALITVITRMPAPRKRKIIHGIQFIAAQRLARRHYDNRARVLLLHYRRPVRMGVELILLMRRDWKSVCRG